MNSMAALFLVLMPVLATAQDRPVTKDDIAKMAKAGVSEAVLLAKIDQDKATFTLSAEDIAALKTAGVTDKVLQVMLQRPAAAVPARQEPAGEANLVLTNGSHRDVKVVVDEKNLILDIRMESGKDLPRGGRLEIAAAPGEYRLAIEGGFTRYAVVVGAKGAATVSVRGADTSYVDLMTAIIEDANGRTVMILHSQGKRTAGDLRPEERGRAGVRPVLYGPQLSCLPTVSSNVILGAGVGAIIGHQSGHRTQGALIGAGAGLFLDGWGWGWGGRCW